MDKIVTALLDHKQKRKNNLSEDSSGGAFVVGCDHSAGDKDNKNKKGPQCYKCKGWGHKKAECPELKKSRGTASVMIAKKQNDSDSDGDVLTVSSEKSCEAWLLDSASSFHATSKKWFSSYIEEDGGFAHLGDDSGYRIIGVGDIKFKMCYGHEMLLKGVKHVPGLRRNLISLRLLHDEGWLYQAAPDNSTKNLLIHDD